MKKIKKFVHLLLFISLFLCVMGCSPSSKETDPKKVLENAQKKNNELTSSDLTMNLDMKIHAAGQSLPMGLELNCKTKGNKDSIQFSMTGNISSMGVSIPMELYYKDNCIYLNLLNQKMKQEVPFDNLQKQIIPSTQTISLPIDAFKTINMEENSSNQVLSFTADGTKMTDFVNTILSSLMSQLGEDVSYLMKDVTGSMTINSDGYISEATFQLPMSITVPDMGEMSMDLTYSMTLNNPGKQDITIDYPDFSDYTESDLSDFV